MNCDQARTEIIAYLKGELSPEKKARLEEHFARCPNCRHELEGARRLLSWTQSASEDAVVKKVEELIDNAIKTGASDIHFEPQRDNSLLVRYRIDGVLHEMERLDAAQRYGVITRVKMMAEMNVSETSIPQDGRVPWQVSGQDVKYDLRVNSMPFIYGEGVVMRILDQSSILIGLDRLGFSEQHLGTLKHLLSQPNGLIIFSGPTGSGKTTTCYSGLLYLDPPKIKMMTIEDPVEYSINGANQAQINRKAGLTFASALRAFLRQDPDIIFVGETQDAETAVLLTEAAITGHLGITTIHANTAIGVLERWLDFGVQPYLISSTLAGIVSQRLVRKVCKNCAQEISITADDAMMKYLGIMPADLKLSKIMRGKGCPECHNSGYKGRLGLYEILQLDRDLSAMIAGGANTSEIEQAAISKGFKTMRDDAKEKVLAGLTSPEEACRVLAYSY